MSPMVSCIVVSVVAVLTASQICRADKPNFYLDEPGPAEAEHNDKWRPALAKLEVSAAEEPEQVRQEIMQAYDEASNLEKHVYSTLELLSDPDDDCPIELSLLTKLIYAEMDTAELGKLKPYLLTFGKAKFGKCALVAQRRLDRHLRRYFMDQHIFESFFRAVLDLNAESDDATFYEKLRQFDLRNDKYSTKQAFIIAERGESKIVTLTKRQVVEFFVDHHCRNQVYGTIGINMESLNLALALESPYVMNIKYKIMNEYQRICFAWMKPESHAEALDNFMSQLKSTGITSKLLGKCGGGKC